MLKHIIFRCFRSNINNIDISELNEFVKNNVDVILLDVRSPQEFNEYHLNGAVNIPIYELESKCNYILKEKSRLIIVYCQSGMRSKRAIKVLLKNGFKNIYHLKYGLDGI